MFSLNGVALENDTFGWSVLEPSQPLSDLVLRSTELTLHGADGVVSLPADNDAPTVRLVIGTSRSHYQTLLALLSQKPLTLTYTADSTRSAAVELLGTSHERYALEDELDVTVMLRLNEAFWRDSSVSTSTAANLSSASVDVSVFSGLSAPITDAIVRVKGAAGGLVVTDAGSSWFSYGEAIGSGKFLRFESETGKAFLTSSDTWTGGDEVSGDVDFGGPRGVFEITPSFTDPSTRAGKLTVTTTSRSGAQIQVRGKGAYLV